MSTDQFFFLLALFLATMSLTKLMRGRQNHLTQLLRQYVDKQKEWVQKRSRAAALALQAAKSKDTSDRANAEMVEVLRSSQDALTTDATTPGTDSPNKSSGVDLQSASVP